MAVPATIGWFAVGYLTSELLSEKAIQTIDALERGTLGGAALDVFEDEPRVPERLIALPHVVLAPHIGSATRETRQAMCDLAVGNLEAFFAGQALLTPVPECR